MTDTQNPSTVPAPQSDNGNAPVGQLVDAIPPSTRDGRWAREVEWFLANPSTNDHPNTKLYKGESPGSASYLRSTYGLDAQTRNTNKDENTCDLYVRFVPELKDKIMAGDPSRKGKGGRPRKDQSQAQGQGQRSGKS